MSAAPIHPGRSLPHAGLRPRRLKPTPVRWVRDGALVILLAAVAGGAFHFVREKREHADRVESLSAAVRRLEAKIQVQSATRAVETNARGWPTTVDPSWFESTPPTNGLVSASRPWVEVAGPEQSGLTHPPVRVVIDESQAAFWYNPYQGIIRARVPLMLSDEEALSIYNRVNGASLSSIFWCEKPMSLPSHDGVTAIAKADDNAIGGAAGSGALVTVPDDR